MVVRKWLDLRGGYWILVTLTYLSLLYSTGLAFTFGPDTTLSLSYFTQTEPRADAFMQAFPDLGSLKGIPLRYTADDAWKMTELADDAAMYLLQSTDPRLSIAPFKYRILPTWLAGQLAQGLHIHVARAFVFLNVCAVLAAALLFTLHLRQDYAYAPLVALLGGILFVTMLAVTKTLAFPMLDPLSFLWAVLIFMAVKRRNALLYVAAAVAGVLTKELLVVSGLMWLVETWGTGHAARRLTNLALAAVPFAVFVGVRLALGGDALEVNYGFNVLAGEFPSYVTRLLTPGGAAIVVLGVWVTFSFVWLGLFNVRDNPFFKRQFFVIPLVIVTTILLSSRLARVMGILYPLVIPMFLVYAARYTSPPEPAPVNPTVEP